MDNFSSSIVVNLVLSLYNQMTPPVDVGGLPNHVKYCVSVLSLQWATIRTSPVGTPNTFHYRIAQQIFALRLQELSFILNESQMPFCFMIKNQNLECPSSDNSLLPSILSSNPLGKQSSLSS